MAYVRKTDTLVRDILGQVQDMSASAQNDVSQKSRVEYGTSIYRVEHGTPIYKSIFKAVEDAAWALNPELKDQMPKQWKYESERLDVTFKSKDEAVIKKIHFTTCSEIPFMLPTRPLSVSNYNDNLVVPEKYWDSVIISWLEHLAECDAKESEIQDQYNSVYNQIRAYLKTKTSLNVALKDMPELELYVPAQYMAKINEANAPRTKAVVEEVDEVVVNREQLASLGIAHRMTVGAR